MKRLFLSFAVAVLAGSAFGEDLKPSAGGFLGYTFDSQYYKQQSATGTTPSKTELTDTANFVNLGGFFDYTYVEGSLSVAVQTPQQHFHLQSNSGIDPAGFDRDVDTQMIDLDLRVLGKFPFDLGSVILFPLAGIEYSLNLSSKSLDQTGYSQSELNDFFVDLGGGLDYRLNDKFYFRAEAIYSLNLTPTMQSFKDSAANNGQTYSDFGYRLNFVAAVGYNL